MGKRPKEEKLGGEKTKRRKDLAHNSSGWVKFWRKKTLDVFLRYTDETQKSIIAIIFDNHDIN